jgi:carbon-monoxide dehydrogenase medium subunit
MKRLCEEYILAGSVDEALAALSAQPGTRLVSGGSDLLLEIQQGSIPPVRTLVDVNGIEELCALEARAGSLFIGAAVTLTRLANSNLIRQNAQALADAAHLMANPQVCNIATIGGNVAHALPAADGTIALLALDAQAELANLAGRRMVPLQALFNGPGKSTLDPCGELLVGFLLPLQKKGQASAFARRVNPQGIALAMVNLALWLHRHDGRIADVRIAVGPSGPVPRRMTATEDALIGREFSVEIQTHALEVLRAEAMFRTSPHRATAEYRYHLAGILWQEAFSSAWNRAGETHAR